MSIKIGNTAPKKVYIEGDEVKEVYIDSVKIRPASWQPGADTIVYYPLTSTSTVNDLSGNNYTLTQSGTVSFGTYQGVDCCYFNGGKFTTTASLLPQGNTSRTLSVWLYITKQEGGIFCYGQSSMYNKFGIYVSNTSDGIVGTVYYGTDVHSGSINYNEWLHLAVVATSTNWSMYVNGVLMVSQAKTDMNTQGTNLTIGDLDWAFFPFESYMSNVILESKERTAQEIEDYYNQTKSLFQQGWQPGANTLLYMPMDTTNTYTDQSGNNRQTTNNGVAFGTYTSANVDCGYFDSTHIQINPFALANDMTVLCWCYCTGYNYMDGKIFDGRDGTNTFATFFGESPSSVGITTLSITTSQYGTYTNQRVLVSFVITNGTQEVRVMGNGINDYTTGTDSYYGFTPTYLNVGNEWNNGVDRYYLGYMSKLIVESKLRTSAEITDYYNQTKSLYGIS